MATYAFRIFECIKAAGQIDRTTISRRTGLSKEVVEASCRNMAAKDKIKNVSGFRAGSGHPAVWQVVDGAVVTNDARGKGRSLENLKLGGPASADKCRGKKRPKPYIKRRVMVADEEGDDDWSDLPIRVKPCALEKHWRLPAE